MAYTVVAYTVVACIGMVYVRVACTLMAYIVMAYAVTACVVMAHMKMAHTAMMDLRITYIVGLTVRRMLSGQAGRCHR